MKTIKVKKGFEEEILKEFNNRTEEDLSDVDDIVFNIISRVRKNGNKALEEITKEIDKVDLKNMLVSQEEIDEAYDSIDESFKEIIKKAAFNIEDFHKRQKECTWSYQKEEGIVLGQLVTPLDSVGVYVPGGKAIYPSTVLMDVIPAKIAGVERIIMTTPPQKDGKIHPYILTAAKIAGVSEIYKLGGAQAVAALAYGTETIKPVNKIVGPGNIYVARAKKYVFGIVDIDMIAGPSEICIIADKNANERFIAADLLSQAEHDEMAASVLVTTSKELAEKVDVELGKQLKELERTEIARKSIENNGKIFLVDDIDGAFKVSNIIAPEHLELLLNNPLEYIDKVRNAGAVFIGEYSPEPLGDYFAGPNHTLPTGGTAAFASPLGVYDFMKKTSLIHYSKEALGKEKDSIATFADNEGLTAHGNSIRIRFAANS